MLRLRDRARSPRQGAAAVELALLLPFLAFLFLIGVDFARAFRNQLVVTNCARNGAIYASTDPTHAVDTTGIQAAALVDAPDLNPTPNVSSTTGTDASGNPYVQVTVTWSFLTFGSYSGLSDPITISRTVQMRVAPAVPKGG
jgi:Flp pilus assembly protein TadG